MVQVGWSLKTCLVNAILRIASRTIRTSILLAPGQGVTFPLNEIACGCSSLWVNNLGTPGRDGTNPAVGSIIVTRHVTYACIT